MKTSEYRMIYRIEIVKLMVQNISKHHAEYCIY